MKLYFSRGACSLGPRIIINELNIHASFESVDLQTKKTASGYNFLEINPKGAVPTLELDNQEVLTEAAVILQYLAYVGKSTTLLPPESDFTRFRVLEALNYVATEMHKGIGVFFHPKIPQEVKDTVYRPMAEAKLAYLNQKLAKHPYLVGEHFTLPDAYLFVILRWAAYFKFDLKSLSHLYQYIERLNKRPSIEKSLEQEGLLEAKV